MSLSSKVALALVLLAFAPLTAAAQSLSLPIPAAPATASPYGFTIKRVNNLDSAPITFEGQRLFTIAAPLGVDSSAVPPIVQRVYSISAALRSIAPESAFPTKSRFNADTFKVEIGNENGLPTLYATDDVKHENAPIMTVTAADATLNGLSKEELVIEWQSILESALHHAILATQPAYIQAQLRKIPFVVIGGILATLLIMWLRRRLRASGKATDAIERRTVFAALIWLFGLLVFAIWAGIVYWLMTIFPATRAYANLLSDRFLELVIVWIALAVLNRALSLVIVRSAGAWSANLLLTADQRTRIKLRSPTLIRSAENLKAIVLWTIAIFWTLSILSVSAISVLTIGAIAAFALSFAAQSLIKDYLNGFLILAEDQYAIGDYVAIGTIVGTVEDLTLRVTRIRTDEGRLVTIPNSTITIVENTTRSWARVDFRVPVAVSSNIDRAVTVLQTALDELAADPQWSKVILEPPKVLGVDSVSHSGVVLRAWIKVIPTERAPMAREVNQRVGEAFARSGIAIGAPQAMVLQPLTTQPPPTTSPSAEQPPTMSS